MLLDGSEMDSFADLTHTPQGDVKTRIARGILMVSDLTHTPQGDVKNEAMFSLLPKFKNLTHTPQEDGTAACNGENERRNLTHASQGDGSSKCHNHDHRNSF